MSATIIANDDSAAAANRTALDTATGRLTLPTGKIAVNLAASPLAAGLFMAGNQTSLENVVANPEWVGGRALSIRPGGLGGTACLSFDEPAASRPSEIPAGQVGWIYNHNGSDGLGFYPAPVRRLIPGEKVPSTLNFMRAWHGVPFKGSAALQVPTGHGLKVGDEVFVTDGPYINECVGEWRRIAALGAPDSVVLNIRLSRQYAHGTLVAGPWPRKLAFQGIMFRGTWGPVLIQQCVDIGFGDTVFDLAQGWVSVVGSSRISFANFAMPAGFQSSASNDIRFDSGTIREVQGEQCACDLRFNYVRFGPGPVDSKVGCTDWQLRNCITEGALFVYDGWLIDNHIAYGPVCVRGKGAIVRDLWSAQGITVSARYQGQPVGAGTGVTLDNVFAPSIHVEAGTSGTIRRRQCPVTGSTENWKVTPP